MTSATRTAAVMVHPGTIEIRELPVPEIGAHDVLVEVEAVGVCGSDTHFFEEGRIGDLVVVEPLVLGHEAAGVILAAGSAVDPARVGQRVALEPQRTCGRCTACKRGEYNLCGAVEFFGCPPHDHGAFTDLTVVRSDVAHAVPDGMTAEEAAMLEPLSVAVAALRKVGMRAGDRVLITGAGPIGLLLAAGARAFGAVEVVVSDPEPSRRERASAWGTDTVVDRLDHEQRLDVDVFIDASGALPAIREGVRHCRPGAHVGLVGMGADELRLPFAAVQHAELSIHGVFRYANTWPTAIGLAARGRIPLASMVTARFGLAGTADALTEAKRNPAGLKSVVLPGVPGGRLDAASPPSIHHRRRES